jgi:hypothetical protein
MWAIGQCGLTFGQLAARPRINAWSKRNSRSIARVLGIHSDFCIRVLRLRREESIEKTRYSQSPERGAGKRNVLCFQFTLVFPRCSVALTRQRLLVRIPGSNLGTTIHRVRHHFQKLRRPLALRAGPPVRGRGRLDAAASASAKRQNS